jgi:hypothetical protein
MPPGGEFDVEGAGLEFAAGELFVDAEAGLGDGFEAEKSRRWSR